MNWAETDSIGPIPPRYCLSRCLTNFVFVSEPKMGTGDIDHRDNIYVSEDTSYLDDIFAKRRLANLMIWPVILVLSILFLALVIGRNILHRQPFKWMQILATVGMMGSVVYRLVIEFLSEPQHTGKLWPTIGHCQTGLIFMYWFLLLANAGVALVTLERISTLFRSTSDSQSGCPVPVAAAGLTLASIFTLAISAGIILGLGVNLFAVNSDGAEVYVCTNGNNRYPLYWASTIQNLLTALLTIILLIAYVAKRATSEKPLSMDPDQVIPILVANVVFIAGLICYAMELENFIIVEPHFVAYSLVLAIWLFAEGAVRRAFKPVCCPWCSAGSDEEKVGLLGHR